MRPTEDTYRHKDLRKKLVQGIHTKGITNDRVLDTIFEGPSHVFLLNYFFPVPFSSLCLFKFITAKNIFIQAHFCLTVTAKKRIKIFL